MYNEATTEFERALTISPGALGALSGLGDTYALAGRRAEARQVLDKLSELAKREYVAPLLMAQIYAGLGQKDRAFEWMEKSYDDRSLGIAGKSYPGFDPLRSDPRFQDLLRRMNLQP